MADTEADSTGHSGGAACRTALVTGGTSGLGLAMATALAGAGLRVAVAGRSAGRAATAAEPLPGAFGVEVDVRDEDSVARAVETTWSRLDGIDLLVNNAGIGMRTVNPRFLTEPRGFWTVPPDGFRDVIATNLTGYFLVAREVVPRMLAAGRGRVVNISVSDRTMTRAGFVPYGPSRAGTESLSRIMAADLRETPVTVNMLLPGGPTRTGMVPAEYGAGPRSFLEPDIMGPPIVWLASAAASGVRDERIIAAEFVMRLRDNELAGAAGTEGADLAWGSSASAASVTTGTALRSSSAASSADAPITSRHRPA